MLKAVILITVHRRYNQLKECVDNIRKLEHEFAVKPDIIIVWAQPENAIDWFIRELQPNHIIYREKLLYEGEKGGTTYPESHNINIGLNFINDNYKNCYCIVHASDIIVNEGGYGEIDRNMQEGSPLCVFHWQNNCVSSGCFHTNIFAVSMNKDYWPPVCTYEEYDTLEWAWGKILGNYTRPPGVPPKRYNYRMLNHQIFKDHNKPIKHPFGKRAVSLSTLAHSILSTETSFHTHGKIEKWYDRVWKFIIEE